MLSLNNTSQLGQRLSSAVETPVRRRIPLRYFFMSYRFCGGKAMILGNFHTHAAPTGLSRAVGSARARLGIKTEQGTSCPITAEGPHGLLTPRLMRAGGRTARGRDGRGFKQRKEKRMSNDTTNQVLRGDCEQVLRRCSSESIDAVIADPPYGVRYRDRSGRSIANDEDPANIPRAFTDIYRVLKPDNFCVCFYGWNRVDAFFRAWRDAGLQPVGHLVRSTPPADELKNAKKVSPIPQRGELGRTRRAAARLLWRAAISLR